MTNKEIKTPKMGVKIGLKEWISGEEGEEISSPITDIKFKIDAMGQGTADMNIGEAIRKSTEKAVNIVVLNVEGDDKDVWQRIRKMPKVDYDFILNEVDKIVKGVDFKKPISKKDVGTD